MYGLADCNNFFVSCERVFNPSLIGKPVVVLSNNDGCVISRSDEAKALGIKMGEPVFKIKDLAEKKGVISYSANFALYGDLSARIMNRLKSFAPSIEIYSIDEALLSGIGARCRKQTLPMAMNTAPPAITCQGYNQRLSAGTIVGSRAMATAGGKGRRNRW